MDKCIAQQQGLELRSDGTYLREDSEERLTRVSRIEQLSKLFIPPMHWICVL